MPPQPLKFPSLPREAKYSASISKPGDETLGIILKRELVASGSSALGIVSAFVSIGGFRDLLAITRKSAALECRLLAGISGAITHPQALSEALDAGWKVRFGSGPRNGIFHPKMILSGQSFKADGSVNEPSFLYVGSSNLTIGGLHRNIECGVIANQDFGSGSLASCFAALWESGKRATAAKIESYADVFAKRNRERSTEDLETLGVSDTAEGEAPKYGDLTRKKASNRGEAMPEKAAAAAWTGLESFTGEYQFQVEFPQAAGLVLNRIIGRASSKHVPVLCADGEVRDMTFRFYTDNGMFRLNIPNDTPGVELARERHKGIALVEVSDRKGVVARLTIIPPGAKLEAVVKRSFLLGTWGTTPTRNYGWY